MGTEIRRRRSRWFAAGIAAATAVFVLDAATADKVVTLVALLAVPPFVAAVGASRLQTLIVALYSIALTVPAGLIDGIFGKFEHVLKAVVVAVVALAAVRIAAVRERAELGNAFDLSVANALAESSTLDEATPRLLEAIGDLLGWQAGALWEITQGSGTLRCVSTWLAPTAATNGGTASRATRVTTLSAVAASSTNTAVAAAIPAANQRERRRRISVPMLTPDTGAR